MQFLAQAGRYAPHMMDEFYGMGVDRGFYFDGIWRFVPMALFALFLIGLIVWVVLYVRRSTSTAVVQSTPAAAVPHVDEALRIVRERFARGEIDADEYQRLTAALH